MGLELQQRAVEYNSIIKEHNNIREGLFEMMPPLEIKTNQPYTNGFNGDDLDEEILTEEEIQQQQMKQQQEAAKTLLNIFSEDTAPEVQPKKQTNADLLDGIFGESPAGHVMTPVQQTGQIDLMSNNSDLLFSLSGKI